MKEFFRIVRVLLTYSQKKNLAFLLALVFFGTLFELMGIGLIIPVILSIIDPDFVNKFPEIGALVSLIVEPTYNNIVILGVLALLIFYIFKTLFLAYMAYKQGMILYDVKEDVGRRLFTGYMFKPYVFYLTHNSAELIRNLTSEVANLGVVLRAAAVIFIDGIILVSVFFLLVYVEPLGTISIFLVLIFSVLMFQLATKDRLIKYGKSRQYHGGKLIQHVQQGISSVKDVKVLGREMEFIDWYNNHNTKGVKAERFQYILSSMPRLFLEMVVIIGLVLLVCILLWSGKSASSISLVLSVYAVATFRLLPSVNRILAAIQQLRFCFPSVSVLVNELSAISNDDGLFRKKQGISTNPLNKEISANGLSFKHVGSNNFILKDINLIIKRGSCVGFVGISGAGKSTFVDIILGLIKPTSGSILIDGVDIHQNLGSWQQSIGYVSQHIYLTDDTIRRNIAFGVKESEINDAAILKAIDSAQLNEVISELPENTETLIGEHGVRFSGGQRQRIGIARALYHNPSVLILDEATSALDKDTEAEVMKTIEALHGQKTIIIVSHNHNTLSNCDKICLIENGKIVN